MNRTSKKFRIVLIAAVCAAAVITAIAVLTISKSGMEKLYGRNVSLDASREMTAEERSGDFAELCDFIEKNSPVIYEGDELYGLTYNETKAYYSGLLDSVQSDFEYYATLVGYLKNIPGTHLNVGFPGAAFMTAEMSEELSKNKSFQSAQSYWNGVIREACAEHFDDEYASVVFTYYSGEYRAICEPDIYGLNKATLLTVNGIPADEYIMLLPSVIKIKYDHAAGKPFRDNIIFNDRFGKKCTVEYLSDGGEVSTIELYGGVCTEAVMNYIDIFKPSKEETDPAGSAGPAPRPNRAVITIPDKENNIITVIIDTFDSETVTGEMIADTILKSAEQFGTVIVDIRNNGGGYYSYAEETLSALSPADIQITEDIYRTEESYKRSSEKKGYEKCENGSYVLHESYTIEGKAPRDTKFYLLISDNTASSADWLAYQFKRNKLGTVLGVNAAGGERDGMISLNFLENSGIYYYYTEFQSFNPDGTGSSAYGTVPDIYLTSGIENYFIRKQLIEEGENPHSLENRLKWDGTFRQAYETAASK